MKHAQFKNIKYDYTYIVSRQDDDLERTHANDVRVSEWIEIEFPPLPQGDVISGQIAALDAKQRQLVTEHLAALQEIADARAKLLSLTHEAAA